MNAEAWPTEAAATAAVEAAAKKAYDMEVEVRRHAFPPGVIFREWEQIEPAQKIRLRVAVLPLVWAALGAVPDPRHVAWAEGREAGHADAMYEERGTGANSTYPHENPYPSGL